MHVTSVERPEVLQPSPAETALPPRDSRISQVFDTFVSGAIGRPYTPPADSESLPLRHAFDEIIRQNFGQESKARSYLNKVEKVKDVGYLAITKWQNRELSLDRIGSWIDKRPGLRRTITLLGSTAAVTTVWTLASRATQAYAMTKHGMDLGLHGNTASAPPHASPLDSLTSDSSTSNNPHGSIDVTTQASAPTSESIHLAASTSEEWNYSSGAKTISPREGWFNQFREMGIRGNNTQLDSLLRDVGDNLHDRGLAYYDHDAQEWRMKLVDPNSSGSGYHHTQGTGSLREQDLDYIMREAANHNLAEHNATGGSANHQHPPTEPDTSKPNNNHPPATSDPDLKDAAENAKHNADKAEKGFVGFWDRYVANPWDDFVDTIAHGTKEAWNEWQTDKWIPVKLILGVGTLAAYAANERHRRSHPTPPRPLDPLYPTGPSPFDPPFARHSHVPPLTNRGRASEGLSKLRERASTSGWATRARERWANRRGTSVPASRKDPVGKP